MKILVLNPMVSQDMTDGCAKWCKEHSDSECELVCEGLTYGCDVIKHPLGIAMSAMAEVEAVIEAERKGYDAVTLLCFYDPNLEALYTAVDIPVVGPLTVSCYYAAMLGDKFSCLLPCNCNPATEVRLVRTTGLESRLASVRGVEFTDPEMTVDKAIACSLTKFDSPEAEDLVQDIVNTCIKCIDEDGARAMIIAAGGFIFLGNRIRKGLKDRGYQIPVIEPLPLAIEVAKNLIKLKLGVSREIYRKSVEQYVAKC